MMECTSQYGRPGLVIKGVPNIPCFRVNMDIIFSLLTVIVCGCLLANPEDDMRNVMPRVGNLMPLIIVTLVIFILRIPLAISIEIGSNTKNLRLLWLGLVGQIITLGIGKVLTIWALLILDYDNKLDSLVFLLAFTFLPIHLIFVIGKRITQIKINSDADTMTA